MHILLPIQLVNITYPIHERFTTFQGEGAYTGKPAFFIRTYGCPVHCPWCDSAGTWHPDWIPKHIERFTVDRLVDEAIRSQVGMVVITGGEPAIFNLSPLVDMLHGSGLRVHLETSGAFPIQGDFDWITLSPKRWKIPLGENVLLRASEFKIIVERPEDIDLYLDLLRSLGLSDMNGRIFWFHPEWSHREDPTVLKAISKVVTSHTAGNFRAGWQIHKLYSVDGLDLRARPLVPLGGDPARGT